MTNFVHSKDALQLQRPSSETVFGLVFEGTPQMVFGALGIQWCWTSGWNGFIPCLDTHMKALNHWGRIGNCWNRSPRCWRTFADRNSHRIYTVNKESAKYHQKSRIVSDIKITLNYIYISNSHSQGLTIFSISLIVDVSDDLWIIWSALQWP